MARLCILIPLAALLMWCVYRARVEDRARAHRRIQRAVDAAHRQYLADRTRR